jgi:hypothetical protein
MILVRLVVMHRDSKSEKMINFQHMLGDPNKLLPKLQIV